MTTRKNSLAFPVLTSEPEGTILLALAGETPAGCIALKPLKPNRAIEAGEAACEMKRLWVAAGVSGTIHWHGSR